MPKKNVVVECYLAHNLGDDLFLISLLKRYPREHFIIFSDSSYKYLKNQFPNLEIIYIGNSKAKHLIRIITNFVYYVKKIKFVYNADALITIGGSLYIEQKYNSLSSRIRKELSFLKDKIIAKVSKKHFVLGANFGPYYTKRFLNYYREYFSSECDDVCFREKFSADIFSELDNVRYAPDILLTTNIPNNNKKKQVFISVVDLNNKKFGNLAKYAKQYDDLIVKYINYYTSNNYKVVLCSFCSSEGDDIAVKRISKQVQVRGNLVKSMFYNDNPDDILSEIGSSDIVIGTRFHAIILGLTSNAKVLPIIYSEKTTHVLQEIGWDMNNSIDLKQIFTSNTDILPCAQLLQIDDTKIKALDQFKSLDVFFG